MTLVSSSSVQQCVALSLEQIPEYSLVMCAHFPHKNKISIFKSLQQRLQMTSTERLKTLLYFSWKYQYVTKFENTYDPHLDYELNII